jgi:signal transduction histidine kinase
MSRSLRADWREVLRFAALLSLIDAASVSRAEHGDTRSLPDAPLLLTNIARIKQLKDVDAMRGHPVRVRGVVTFQNGARDAVIHDGHDGVFVARPAAASDLVPGQLVEVEGVTGLAGYAPRIEAREVCVLGTAELPSPRQLPFDWLSSGREDCQWVEVRGVIRSFVRTEPDNYHVDISMQGNRLRIRLMDFVTRDCSKLIDATVRVRGVLGSNRNSRRQIVAPLLWATGGNFCVEGRPVEDPFATRIQPVSSLLQFAPDAIPNHRVRVRGIVTHQEAGKSVFIRDGAQGLWLQTRETSPLKPGDVVDAVGFEEMGRYSPVLEDVIYRKTGEAPPPRPLSITEEEALRGDHDADFITMEGQLLDSYQGGDDRILVLQSDRVVFNAHLACAGQRDHLPRIQNGSRLRLAGICLIEEVLGRNVDKVTPTVFRILLRSPADIVVLQRPSWWTLPRLLWALASLALVTTAVSAWVISLRRRVHLQTAIIGKKIQREAVLEERHRVAREIHDTLAQSYSGIGFQIESVASQLPQDSGVRHRLEIAKQMVRHGQEEFRRSLANLRAQELERGELSEALGESGRQMTAGSGVAFQLSVHGTTRRLEETVENNLLRIGQECITNALRHARACCISIELSFEPGCVRMRVSDNGQGCDTQALERNGHGHFGWRGIRERAEQIRAGIEIESGPGRGTSVLITVRV